MHTRSEKQRTLIRELREDPRPMTTTFTAETLTSVPQIDVYISVTSIKVPGVVLF